MRFLFYLGLAGLGYWLVKGLSSGSGTPSPSSAKNPQGEKLVQDALTKVYIPESRALLRVIAGERYFFSNEESYREFLHSHTANS